MLAGLLMPLCAACAMRPGAPARTVQPPPANRLGLYTVDTRPEGPMLYPVMSKAIQPLRQISYAANSFKLVNEKWEDVTGYINGSYEYIYVNGEVYGVQIQAYEPGEVEYDGQRYVIGQKGAPYILGLDGKPIAALDGLIYLQPWYFSASMPKDLIYVTTVEAYNAAAEIEWGMWPDVGVFNLRTGKLQIPVEYTQLILLDGIALGAKDGAMLKLDHSGNVLAALGKDWFCENYDEGDTLLRVSETTYIDRDGEIALELNGIRGASNFRGDYAYGWLGEPGDDYVDYVFFDRQGRRVGDKTYYGIYGYRNYYVTHGAAGSDALDLSLQAVALPAGDINVNNIVGDMLVSASWDDETSVTTTTVFDIPSGKELFSMEGSPWHEKGFFMVWDNNLSLYDMEGQLIFGNARVLRISGDGKYIYVDDGRHMGYIDAQGDWVYRINAAYYNLED
jgi:hypothetical protein